MQVFTKHLVQTLVVFCAKHEYIADAKHDTSVGEMRISSKFID